MLHVGNRNITIPQEVDFFFNVSICLQVQRDEKLHAGAGGKILMDDKMISRTLMQFFLDGYDTLSSVLTHCFYNLAINPEAQAEAYAEVEAMVEEKGGLDTSAVSELKYLDGVFMETLRVLAFPYTMRRCNKPWKIPGSDITLPVGTRVMINIGGLHMDPEYWDEPTLFRPERFNSEVSFRQSSKGCRTEVLMVSIAEQGYNPDWNLSAFRNGSQAMHRDADR